jgi:hypothetical protein
MSGPRSFSSVSQAESTVQVTLGILEPPLHTSWCHLWGALGGCDVEPSLEAYCRACWRPNTALPPQTLTRGWAQGWVHMVSKYFPQVIWFPRVTAAPPLHR